MKKFLTLFSTLLLMVTLYVQTCLSQTFDGATSPATGWTEINSDGAPPDGVLTLLLLLEDQPTK